ncbi:hypothetical protein [Mesorhizobium sp.]|uniref:hypothetical protein n=1 Tax=Mesorhizobium sp. TaxID=1871066 RepID=UPI0025FD611B|nr:hypothetical protein [Mesorhizobium sp.]
MKGYTEKAIERQAALYRSSVFRSSVSNALGRARAEIENFMKPMLEAGCIPQAKSGMPPASAVWADAAMILVAHAGRQQRPASVVRVTTRLCSLPHQLDVGRGRGQASPLDSLGMELAELLRRLGASESGVLATTRTPVQIMWSEGGTALFATIDYAGGRKRIFSDMRLPAPLGGLAGNWDFVQLPTVGGTLLSAESLASFAGIFRTKTDPAPSDPDESPTNSDPKVKP